MKKPAAPTKTQAGFFPEADTHDFTDQPAKFHGTDNPRELRALALLLRRPSVPREAFDREVGCSNGPDLVKRMRDAGLGEHLRCARIEVIDRDGIKTKPGVYWLTQEARRVIRQWFARNQKGAL